MTIELVASPGNGQMLCSACVNFAAFLINEQGNPDYDYLDTF